MLGHRPLPVGVLTIILTVNGARMTVISDDYWYIVRAAAAGVLGDFIAFGLRNVDRPDVPEFSRLPFRRFGTPPTCSPWRSTKGGLGWSIHMTLGAPFLAGVAGLSAELAGASGSCRAATGSHRPNYTNTAASHSGSMSGSARRCCARSVGRAATTPFGSGPVRGSTPNPRTRRDAGR